MRKHIEKISWFFTIIIMSIMLFGFFFAYMKFLSDRELDCKKNGGKVIYNTFGIYEKCIK